MIVTPRAQLMAALPDFGRQLGAGGKAIERCSTGRASSTTGATSNPDADQGFETNRDALKYRRPAAADDMKAEVLQGVRKGVKTRCAVRIDCRRRSDGLERTPQHKWLLPSAILPCIGSIAMMSRRSRSLLPRHPA